jgi:hypothetical protein
VNGFTIRKVATYILPDSIAGLDQALRKNLLKPLILIAPLCLILTGCGGSEPSEADIRQAFEQEAQGVNGLLGGVTGQKMEILGLTKHQCKERQDSTAVVCSFTVKMKIPVFGEREQTAEQAFIKGNDGWRMVGR